MFNETFEVNDFTIIKKQLLIWGSRFSSCSFLDNHQYTSPWQQQECILAGGALHEIHADPGSALEKLQQFIDLHSGEWIFGHLSYDLKNEIEPVASLFESRTGFTGLCFFVPETIIQLSLKDVIVFSHVTAPKTVWQSICETAIPVNDSPEITALQPRISKDAYLTTIEKLKRHIHRGDCYEINFCQEFFSEQNSLNPVALYEKLSSVSPNPFSCYYKINQSHLVCASPERYLARKGNQLFSQPIKGTASRNLQDPAADALKIIKLQNDQKERSENVMVVDLVRNDLSRICREGSVKVEELFAVYTYPHVHQMISTVSGEVKPGTSFTDIIRATFPMGSMTGAPKKRVMELIADYESGSRGLFSGAVGYISPAGNFDFNVVIRSLMYNANTKYLSYWVGGGITWYSQALQEYEECMLKAMAIKKVLQSATPI